MPLADVLDEQPLTELTVHQQSNEKTANSVNTK